MRVSILVLVSVLKLIVALPVSGGATAEAALPPSAEKFEQQIVSRGSFEVASVRQVAPNADHQVGVNVYPGGRIVLKGLSLKEMICTAFNFSYWQVSGGESWVGKILYDVDAIPPNNEKRKPFTTRHTLFEIEDVGIRELLQSLLIERFHLRFHCETRAGKTYILERSGKALRLVTRTVETDTASKPSNAAGSIGFAEQWVLHDTTMTQLAKFASDYVLHCPVEDRTGLSGAFDYKSAPEDWDSYKQDSNISFIRLLNEVGLKLRAGRGPVEMFFIDQADEATPN